LHSKPFLGLDPEQQRVLVQQLFESSTPDLETGRDFVLNAKELTARVYYSTEIGMRELNKNGRVPAVYSGSCLT
jgi:hypothetical protein